MGVPKRKVSRARRDSRSANKQVEVKNIVACQTCQAPLLPHQLCFECGYYKGIKKISTKTDRMYKRGESRKAKSGSVSKNVQQESSESTK